ncbi:normal mucosa of esophagus-specific gene 1 protein-like isoform X2 [Ischnura elegans]|nr:normal mucosa of esophagus-specific gene 1 protein-like isoform X2 [Ischnura elegans]
MDWKGILKRNKMFYVLQRFELLPIITIVGAVSTGVVAAIAYATYKLDIQFDRRREPRIDTMIDLLNPRSKKLITIQQEYKPMTELHAILTEMKQAEKELAAGGGANGNGNSNGNGDDEC